MPGTGWFWPSCWAHSLPWIQFRLPGWVDQMLSFALRSCDFLRWERMTSRASPRTFPSDENSYLLCWHWPVCFGGSILCRYSVRYSSFGVNEFHNSCLYIAKSSLSVHYVFVCMLPMSVELFRLDTGSSLIFFYNTKVIKHFWALICSLLCVDL